MNYDNFPVSAVQCGGQCGSRPEIPDYFPIAMAYVPWQTWSQPYSLEQGFNRGTIFPELDLPFVMGGVCQ